MLKVEFEGGIVNVAELKDLQPGDFITTASNTNPIHIGIKVGTNAYPSWSPSSASHAMIYVGAHRVIEAVNGGGSTQAQHRGGVTTNTLAGALTDFPWAHAYTMHGLTAKNREDICAYARHMLNHPYEKLNAFLSSPLFSAHVADGPACFCSEFVAEAYRRVGKPITKLGQGKSYPYSLEAASTRTEGVRSRGWLKHGDPAVNGYCDRQLYKQAIPLTDWVQEKVFGRW